jgi:hypothetical protein
MRFRLERDERAWDEESLAAVRAMERLLECLGREDPEHLRWKPDGPISLEGLRAIVLDIAQGADDSYFWATPKDMA